MIRMSTKRYTFQLVQDADPTYPVTTQLVSPRDVARVAHELIGAEITECLLAFFLNARQRVTGYAEIARGTLNATRFTPRDVLTPALHAACCGIVLVHNHGCAATFAV